MGLFFQLPRPTWTQVAVSLLVASLGLAGAHALEQVDQDLRIMYTEYTLAATDLAHITADLMRYRTTVIRALEAPTRREYERIIASLPDQRLRVERAVDRFASTGLHVSRSGHSEQQDLQAVRESLEMYFSAAQQTIMMLNQMWNAGSPQQAAELRTKAEQHAAENAGAKLVQATLALDRLLESVAEVGKDWRDEGKAAIRTTSLALVLGTVLLALLNLLGRRSSPRQVQSSDVVSLPSDPGSAPLESFVGVRPAGDLATHPAYAEAEAAGHDSRSREDTSPGAATV